MSCSFDAGTLRSNTRAKNLHLHALSRDSPWKKNHCSRLSLATVANINTNHWLLSSEFAHNLSTLTSSFVFRAKQKKKEARQKKTLAEKQLEMDTSHSCDTSMDPIQSSQSKIQSNKDPLGFDMEMEMESSAVEEAARVSDEIPADTQPCSAESKQSTTSQSGRKFIYKYMCFQPHSVVDVRTFAVCFCCCAQTVEGLSQCLCMYFCRGGAKMFLSSMGSSVMNVIFCFFFSSVPKSFSFGQGVSRGFHRGRGRGRGGRKRHWYQRQSPEVYTTTNIEDVQFTELMDALDDASWPRYPRTIRNGFLPHRCQHCLPRTQNQWGARLCSCNAGLPFCVRREILCCPGLWNLGLSRARTARIWVRGCNRIAQPRRIRLWEKVKTLHPASDWLETEIKQRISIPTIYFCTLFRSQLPHIVFLYSAHTKLFGAPMIRTFGSLFLWKVSHKNWQQAHVSLQRKAKTNQTWHLSGVTKCYGVNVGVIRFLLHIARHGIERTRSQGDCSTDPRLKEARNTLEFTRFAHNNKRFTIFNMKLPTGTFHVSNNSATLQCHNDTGWN